MDAFACLVLSIVLSCVLFSCFLDASKVSSTTSNKAIKKFDRHEIRELGHRLCVVVVERTGFDLLYQRGGRRRSRIFLEGGIFAAIPPREISSCPQNLTRTGGNRFFLQSTDVRLPPECECPPIGPRRVAASAGPRKRSTAGRRTRTPARVLPINTDGVATFYISLR